ncbi:MAG: PP2C family protein-serine/threonine phosphatase [Nocardioides sp.]
MTWARELSRAWRSGTRSSQRSTLGLLLLGVLASSAVSLTHYELFPLAGYFLWLLLGMLLLRFEPLVVLTSVIVVAGVVTRIDQGVDDGGRLVGTALLVLSVALVLYAASRQRSGLPTPLSEALLSDLRDRLTAQGQVPALPAGWHAQSAMIAAHGVGYAGDFMVADLNEDEQHLELVLVDVVGKGLTAAPAALLLAGALGGLIGAVNQRELLEAANHFLLRQKIDDSFATAVHVSVDLTSGAYTILSAGHPPALRCTAADGVWSMDNSRGLALGVMLQPELNASHGVLGSGDALLFYTDGVVESFSNDLDVGVEWLQRVAQRAFQAGVDGAAERIIAQVTRGDDDRAVLIISRS